MTFVDVAGLRTWHEIQGDPDGTPVVLLHGAFGGALSWFAQAPVLAAAGYRVHLPERRGHAHTPDVDGPLTYDVMAQDTIAYLDQEIGTRSHLVGWSDGAVVALLVAMRRPDLVDRQVLIGQYYNSAGKVTDGIAELVLGNREAAMGFLRAGYDPFSPDGPGHFPVIFDKTVEMFNREPEIDLESLATVTAPTLVLQGDQDDVTVEHSIAVTAALPSARLAVLPGSHALPIESPDVVNPLIIGWLRGGPPPPLWTDLG